MAQPCRLPIIDFSALFSEDSTQRSKTIQELVKACEEWGCFLLVNHEISKATMDALLDAAREFFNLPDEEKKQYEVDIYSLAVMTSENHMNIVYSHSMTPDLWWKSLRLYLRPNEPHFPDKAKLLQGVVPEYSVMIKKVMMTLMEALSEALKLEKSYVDQILKLDSNFHVFVANLYPTFHEGGQAIGLQPHTDVGLFTTIIDNGVPGLQIEKDGQWFQVVIDCPDHEHPLWVNVADLLEVFSNGRFKSVNHRAIVNSEKERISIAMTNYPIVDTVIEPAAALVQKDGQAFYRSMTYVQCLLSKYE